MIDPTNQAFRKAFENYLMLKGYSEKNINNHMSQATNFLLCYKSDFKNFESLGDKILEFYSAKRSYLAKYSLKYLFEFLEKQGNYDGLSNYYESLLKKNKHLFKQKTRRIKKKWIPKDKMKLLLDALPQQYRMFCLVQYETACRGGALINLQRNDISRNEDGTASITLREKGDKLINKRLSETLSKEILKFIENKSFLSGIWPFGFTTLSKYIKRTALEVLKEPFSTHWFRSCRAVHLLQEGHDIVTVMRILGHADIRTTYKYIVESGLDPDELVSKDKVGWLYDKKTD